MGNTQTPDGADHDIYRRPGDGAAQDAVQIVDDGSVKGPAASGGEYGTHDGDGPGVNPDGGPGADGAEVTAVPGTTGEPQRKRFNGYLLGAWGMVAVMLGLGLGWLTGAFSAPQYYDPSGNQTAESASVIAMNLYSMGPFLFLFGMIGAFTLLTVQAAGFRRGAGPKQADPPLPAPGFSR